ncbi:unnamed protein product, partial [Mesorhabditis belari]|uniref:EF-hand domain-containing protein n=1 Tax=Mesorhabditis belari TaxID=2138241 RepID=A0AAF3E8W6_9BILA
MKLLLFALFIGINAFDERMANENVNSFDSVDVDNNAKVDIRELTKWLNERGMTIEKVKGLFSQYDIDGDSNLDVAEFVPLAYAFSQKPVDTEETIFKRMDVNGDGVVDHNEQTIRRLAGDGTIIDGVLAVADTNQDGNLAYSEFLNALTFNKPKTQEKINQEMAQSIISYIDSNGDLRLQVYEVQTFASKYAQIKPEEIQILFQNFDLNADQVLDINELSQFPMKISNLLHLTPPPAL